MPVVHRLSTSSGASLRMGLAVPPIGAQRHSLFGVVLRDDAGRAVFAATGGVPR